MTAEVAIINRHAIALAADSAVTVGLEKVWSTANKLFSLGPKHDIAIMVYGAGDYLGIEWETVVKEFRRRSIGDQFKTVEDCAEAFRKFLLNDVFSNEKEQRHSVIFPVWDILGTIGSNAAGETEEEKLDYYRRELDRYRQNLLASPEVLPDLDKAVFLASFEQSVMSFAGQDTVFGGAAQSLSEEILSLAFDCFRVRSESRYSSGVVVAGFGTSEFFPSLANYTVDGRWLQNLRWWKGEKCKNLNDTSTEPDFPIVPFAQDDMSYQFMAGISFEYLSFLRKSLSGVMHGAFAELITKFVEASTHEAASEASSSMADALVASFMENLLNKVRNEQFLPINRAVAALPKEEMALLAEALVDLTSLKRKVDSQLQSVGGPVDVAVISKGDGFIWMKRKHYFDGSKNHDYFARKKKWEQE